MKIMTSGLCVLALAGAAAADPVDFPSGDPVPGNSWSQGFNTTFTGLDFIGVSMNTPGSTFTAPLFSTPEAGWGVFGNYGSAPTIFGASGPALASGVTLFNTVHFAGDISTPVNYDRYLFSGDTLVAAFNYDWNGVVLVQTNITSSAILTRGDFELAVIPLPSAAAMAGLGLLGLSGRRRRSVA